MSNAPLMPKATAVWLVDNTALTFDQVADFTKMHPLEVRAIADGDAAQGIKGMDPISNGQLTRLEIEKGEQDPNYRLKLEESKVALPPQAKKKGPRYTPVNFYLQNWDGHTDPIRLLEGEIINARLLLGEPRF